VATCQGLYVPWAAFGSAVQKLAARRRHNPQAGRLRHVRAPTPIPDKQVAKINVRFGGYRQ